MNFKGEEESLDTSTLNNLVAKMEGLQELMVSNMTETNDKVRTSIVNIIKNVIAKSPPLTKLRLFNMGIDVI